MVRVAKREPVEPHPGGSGAGNGNVESGFGDGKRKRGAEALSDGEGEAPDGGESDVLQRRVLRSRYLQVKNRISEEKDDMAKVDSDKFKTIIQEVDSLHQLVQKPREQVADAEALLDITNILVTSVKSHCNEGLTPSDFVSCLLRDFGQQGISSSDTGSSSIRWKDIGLAASHVFSVAPGCSTMVGPMNTEIKPRKVVAPRKRTKLTQIAVPEELEEAPEEKTDTDKNMAIMFDILRKNRKVRLENLILNRISFAQTVENLFALSFLIRDGRAEITIDGQGHHLVAPRNAPASSAVRSKEVSHSHFVFRFDFRDWKLMLTCVGNGEELMPHRNVVGFSSGSSQPDATEDVETVHQTTPIRKFSRNRGFVMQEPSVVAESSESDESAAAAARAAIRKGKRKLI